MFFILHTVFTSSFFRLSYHFTRRCLRHRLAVKEELTVIMPIPKLTVKFFTSARELTDTENFPSCVQTKQFSTRPI